MRALLPLAKRRKGEKGGARKAESKCLLIKHRRPLGRLVFPNERERERESRIQVGSQLEIVIDIGSPSTEFQF